MNKIVLLLVFLFGLLGSSFARLDIFFDTKMFNSPEDPYVDVLLEFYTPSVTFKKNEAGFATCNIEITQLLKQNDSIVKFDKFVLTQEFKDTNQVIENLIDVKRYFLKNKQQYELELIIKDLNSVEQEEQIAEKKLTPIFDEVFCEFSEIELIQSFAETQEPNILSKAGYDLLPLVNDYFSPEFDKIAYYVEVYNSQSYFKEDAFIVRHFIQNVKTGEPAGNFEVVRKQTPESIIPIIQVFDINSLPTGSYQIVTQIRDKNNDLVNEKKTSFTRVNLSVNTDPTFLKDVTYNKTFAFYLPEDSLDEYINCLYPIVGHFERNLIVKSLPTYSDTLKRQFIYSFWYNQDNQDPEKAWLLYQREVAVVDRLFGTKVRRGYETDRGRVYLKYGKPNNVEDMPNEPSSYPYQIWHYYKIGRWNNKRFVFYQPDLVTNDYVVLHSDVQGEIQNRRWQADLNKRNSPAGNLDDNNDGNYDHFGNRSGVLFRNP